MDWRNDPTLLAAGLSALVVLVTTAITSVIAIRILIVQRRLAYLQTLIETRGTFIRMMLASLSYLCAVHRISPTKQWLPEDIESIGLRPSDDSDVLVIWGQMYFRTRNLRKSSKEYDELFQNDVFSEESLPWLSEWRVTRKPTERFKQLLSENSPGRKAPRDVAVEYTQWATAHLLYTSSASSFQLVFSVAPNICRALQNSLEEYRHSQQSHHLAQCQKYINDFLRGKWN